MYTKKYKASGNDDSAESSVYCDQNMSRLHLPSAAVNDISSLVHRQLGSRRIRTSTFALHQNETQTPFPFHPTFKTDIIYPINCK